MGARNIVLAGDYKGKDVTKVVGAVKIFLSFAKYYPLDKDTVDSYEIVDKDMIQGGALKGLIGEVFLGPAGMVAGVTGKKGVYTLALNFKDGKRSLIEVDEKIYKILRDSLFDMQTQPKAQETSSADELMKWKGLLDQGVITAEEFEAKKKQLLGL